MPRRAPLCSWRRRCGACRLPGARAFYLCGGGECWAVEAPSYYVFARLQRQPDLDEDKLLAEFCRDLFGKAAPPMARYFRIFLGAADRYHGLTAIRVRPGIPYRGKEQTAADLASACFSPVAIEACRRLLERAAATATSEPERRRIAFFRDRFDYVRLTTLAYRCQRERKQHDTEAARAALHAAVHARGEFLAEMLRRQVAWGADLPPAFQGTLEDLKKSGPPEQ